MVINVNIILLCISMENFLEYFAKDIIGWFFIYMKDEFIKELGIEFPIYRMKIMKGLLDFHLHHWSKNYIKVYSNFQNKIYILSSFYPLG